MTIHSPSYHTCAHCGSLLDEGRFGPELLAMRDLTKSQVLLLRMLVQGRGGCVSMGDMIKELYGHRYDGGPLYADKTIITFLSGLKAKVRKKGYEIENIRGFGYRLYRTALITPVRMARLRAAHENMCAVETIN